MTWEGNSHPEKPENTSMWNEAQHKETWGDHETIFNYLKGHPWEERSRPTFRFALNDMSRTLGDTTGDLLLVKEKVLCVFKQTIA